MEMFRRSLMRQFSRYAVVFGLINFLLSCNVIGNVRVDNAKFTAIEISTPADDRDLAWLNNAHPNTNAFFRISFSTTTDIYSLVRDSDFHASFRAYFCQSGKVDIAKPLGIDSNIYNNAGAISKYAEIKADTPVSNIYIYHVYIRVPPNLEIFDPQDISDICIVILGGQMVGATLRSDPLVVPAALIREVINELPKHLTK